MADTEPVLFSLADNIATITLNRPAAMNAMTDGLMLGISDALAQVVADDRIRVVVLTGAGRGFCAGADLAQVADPSLKQEATNEAPDVNSEDTGDTFNTAMRSLMDDCATPSAAWAAANPPLSTTARKTTRARTSVSAAFSYIA